MSCIDARHAKAVLKMQINKSDRNDAAGIARIMGRERADLGQSHSRYVARTNVAGYKGVARRVMGGCTRRESALWRTFFPTSCFCNSTGNELNLPRPKGRSKPGTEE